jgi:hypothetical protein
MPWSRRPSWRILLLAGRHGVPYICPGAASKVVVLVNLASGRASWRALYLSRSGFEGGGVGVTRSVVARVLTRGCC